MGWKFCCSYNVCHLEYSNNYKGQNFCFSAEYATMLWPLIELICTEKMFAPSTKCALITVQGITENFAFFLTMCGKKPYEVMIKGQEFCYFYKVFLFEHSSNDKIYVRSTPKICAFLQSMPLGPLKRSKCTQKSFCPSTKCALMTTHGLTESFALFFNNVCHKSQWNCDKARVARQKFVLFCKVYH